MSENILTGKNGESLATKFLKENGYRIVETNFRNIFGELDVIAEDKGVICFMEVKTRKDETHGTPFEAVTKWKQRQIIKVAKSYISEKKLYNNRFRFDVVGIMLKENEPPKIELLKSAFTLDQT